MNLKKPQHSELSTKFSHKTGRHAIAHHRPQEIDMSNWKPCLICDSPTSFYFSKTYAESPQKEFMQNIGPVSYYRCKNCGFVLSRTHAELNTYDWAELNEKCHRYLEDPQKTRTHIQETLGNQPPYIEQALMLAILSSHGLIAAENWLDYAAGPGTLSKLLKKYFNKTLPTYDEFMEYEAKPDAVTELRPQAYDLVFNSAMFEHILRREDIDKINRLVAPTGSMIIHTVVCENVPCDPNWFYIKPPVHTAFHTNKSMSILMSQWNYTASIYSPKSKCWVLLKNMEDAKRKVEDINRLLQTEWFIFKEGFVDYWKGF